MWYHINFMKIEKKSYEKVMSIMAYRICHTLYSLVRPFHPTGIPLIFLTMCPFFKMILLMERAIPIKEYAKDMTWQQQLGREMRGCESFYLT